MKKKNRTFLSSSFFLVAIVFLIFYGLSMAKAVLAPIFMAILIAMVLSPVSGFLERHGCKRGWAAFVSDLIFLILVCGILIAVGAEVKRIASNASSIENRLSSLYSQVDTFVENRTGYNLENPLEKSSKNSAPTAADGSFARDSENDTEAGFGGDVVNYLKNILVWTFSSLTTFLLMLVYIFFMLLYRRKFQKGLMYFIPEDKRHKGENIVSDILESAQQYLFGHLILISVLTAFYTLGFSIAGMAGAFTTALIASVLTLVPYVGTMVGNILALAIGFITTGSMSAVWIVLATVAVGQFIESYFLEPYIVGDRMNVNPLFTILSVAVGAAVWGIWGMILFLPLFSFVKAITDQVDFLRPIGYFIGKEDTTD